MWRPRRLGNETDPLMPPSSSNRPPKRKMTEAQKTFIFRGVATIAFIAAAIALGFAGRAYSWGQNDVSDPLNLDGATITNLTVDTIKINTLLDADMANVIPGTWMMPPPPSKKRSTATYDVVPGDRQILLGRSGVTYDLRFPKQLSAYLSREFHVYSNTSQAHTILLTNALNSGSCETSYSDVTWDSERKFPLVKFKDVPGAYIHFKVVDCGTLTLIESRFVDFCTANMSHCEHPKRDVNADWADVHDLNITGELRILNKKRRTLRVGATRQYKTISDALMQFNGRHIGDVIVKVDPGTYVDTVSIGDNSTSSLQKSVGPQEVLGGLQIIGDERTHVGASFVDGAPFQASSASGFAWTVATNIAGVGPFAARPAEFHNPISVTGTGQVYGDGVGGSALDGCAPVAAGSFTGKIALVERGGCAFLTKGVNSDNADAIGVIVLQTGGGPPSGMTPATPTPAIDGPQVMISQADAIILLDALTANPTMQISIDIEIPDIGAGGYIVNLTHPTGLSSLQIDLVGGPIDPIANPNFTALGGVAGDLVSVTTLDSSGEFVVLTKTLASNPVGNLLTFTTPLEFDASSKYSSVTFLPNVILQGAHKFTPTLSLNNAGALIDGITFQNNPTFSSGEQNVAVFFSSSSGRLVNVVFLTSTQFIGHSFESQNTDFILDSNNNLGEISFVTAINSDMIISSHSLIRGRRLTMLSRSVVVFNSEIAIESYTHIRGNRIQIPTNAPLRITEYSKFSCSQVYFGGTGSTNPASGNFAANVLVRFGSSAQFRFLTIDAPRNVGGTIGVTAFDNSKIHIDRSVVVTDHFIGFLVDAGSEVSLNGPSTFNNITFMNYMVGPNSEYLDTNVDAIGLKAAAQFELSDSPAIVDHYYTKQNLVNGPLELSMIVYDFFGIIYKYTGRTYELLNVDGANHTLFLNPGFLGFAGEFIGDSIVSGADTYTFPEVAGSFLKFTVINNQQVQVWGTPGGVFSLASKKRNVIAPKAIVGPRDMMGPGNNTMPAMQEKAVFYQQMLRTKSIDIQTEQFF